MDVSGEGKLRCSLPQGKARRQEEWGPRSCSWFKCTIVIHLVFGSNVSHVSHVSGTYSVTGVYEVSPVIMGDPRPSY